MPRMPVVGEILRRLRRRNPLSLLERVHWSNSSVWPSTNVVTVDVIPCNTLKIASVELNLRICLGADVESTEIDALANAAVRAKMVVASATQKICETIWPNFDFMNDWMSL